MAFEQANICSMVLLWRFAIVDVKFSECEQISKHTWTSCTADVNTSTGRCTSCYLFRLVFIFEIEKQETNTIYLSYVYQVRKKWFHCQKEDTRIAGLFHVMTNILTAVFFFSVFTLFLMIKLIFSHIWKVKRRRKIYLSLLQEFLTGSLPKLLKSNCRSPSP